jgi:transposase
VMVSGRRSGPSCIWHCASGWAGKPALGDGSRQPIGQVGGKGGGTDNQVGLDAGKQVKGRKIHALVDSEGLPMRVVIHSAAIQDRDGAGSSSTRYAVHSLARTIWADDGYNAWQVDVAVAKVPLLRMEIVKRSDNMKGFVVLPCRWVVERTFSSFGRNRRLAKAFENLADTLGAFVALASILLALRRLAGRRSPTHQTTGLHRARVEVYKPHGEGTSARNARQRRGMRRKRLLVSQDRPRQFRLRPTSPRRGDLPPQLR